ncbi:MAG: HD domain-containing protein [bacterium]|nr:HD domain-containing protein [bacterium]
MSAVSVQSKQENQTLPPAALLEWLRAADLPLWIRGTSLKYFRSRLPVARCTQDPADFDRLAADADRFTAPRLQKLRVGAREIKLILDLPGYDESFHLLIFRGHDLDDAPDKNEIVFNVDRLVFRNEDNSGRGWEAHPDLAAVYGEENADLPLRDLEAHALNPVPDRPLPTVFAAAEIVRLAVLPASLDFELNADIKERIARDFRREDAEKLSRKFLHRQFKKLMCGARPSASFLVMSEVGMLEWFLPELAAGRDLAQNRYHKHDIFYHSIYTCDAVDGPNLPLRLAALIHDLGKVNTRRELPNGEATFHNHEMVSTRHAERILRRFAFGPDILKHVRFLVRNHMFHYTGEWTDRAVRRFVKKVPPAMLEDMITLRLADRKGSGKKTALPRAIKDLIRHMERIRAQEAELKIPDLVVDGHTLMELGLPPGPEMGDILKQLLDEVKADRLPNEEAPLRERARALVLNQTGTPA